MNQLKKIVFLCLFSLCLAAHAFSIEFKYAKRIHISEIDGKYHVEINNPWPGTKEIFKYTLVPKEKAKKFVKNEIGYPAEKVVTQSTTFLPFLSSLGVLDALVGVGTMKYINTEEVVKRVKNGKIKEVGNANSINLELLYFLRPDLVLTYGSESSQYNNYPILNKANITNCLVAIYMEESLLGKAEWIKFFGLLFNKLELAEEHFNQIEKRYLHECSLVPKTKTKPTVFLNSPYGSVWYVPSGASWIAHAIKDAGGDYLWKDEMDHFGAMKINTEVVTFKALNADFWLNASHQNWKSYEDMSKTDERFKSFKAYKDKKVFLATKRVNEFGGNDIYESGILNPDKIIRDIRLILYEKKLDENQLYYYRGLK